MKKTTGTDMNSMKFNPKKIMTRAAIIAGALVFALLAGCASVAPAPTSSPASDSSPAPTSVAERAQARWDALLAKDYTTAHSYYSPGFRSKSSVADLEIKMKLQRVRWTEAKYRDNTCSGDACTVRFDIKYQVTAPVPGVDTWKGLELIEEQWVRTGGEWWYVPPAS